MKILPPVTQWLPALARSRGGRFALAAAAVTVGGLSVAVLSRPVGTAGIAAVHVPAAACSALVLDRTAHTIRAEGCPDAAMSGGTSLAAGRALDRADMHPNRHRLTAADLAIQPPETLRTSVWDIDVDAARGPAAPSPAATELTGITPAAGR